MARPQVRARVSSVLVRDYFPSNFWSEPLGPLAGPPLAHALQPSIREYDVGRIYEFISRFESFIVGGTGKSMKAVDLPSQKGCCRNISISLIDGF
jgi:hypothetical protein